MEKIKINGQEVIAIDAETRDTRYEALHASMLARDFGNYSVENEQDAEYGQATVYTLTDGFYATVREIDTRQIEPWEKRPSNLWLNAYVQVSLNLDLGAEEDRIKVSYWSVDVFVDENHEEEAA